MLRPSVLVASALLASCAAAPLPCPSVAPHGTAPPPVTAVVASPASPPFDAAPWLGDLDLLVRELASHYANLEWAAFERKMDLPALTAKTQARLREAKSEADGKRALEGFLEAFGDGHLFLEWNEKGEAKGAATAAPTGPLCARLGYGKREPKPGIDFAATGAFRAIDDADGVEFPGGLLKLPNDVKVGTVRIGLFMEQIHPALCEAARKELALADDAACDDTCEEKLMFDVWNRMTAALERRAAVLQKAGASALVVDLTRNGGGNDWVEAAARVLTKVPLRAPRLGFVRHEHWAKRLRKDLAEVQADRAKKDDPILAKAEATLRAAAELASTPCDLRPLFTAGAPKPACTQLVTDKLYTSGLVPHAKPGSFEGWASADRLFGLRALRYHEGASTLPLFVLVDGQTASASEEFAAMLVDNHAARVVGSLTTGSGCGFTNGGIPVTLPHSQGHLHAPDCARLRADGTNEVSGLVPDVLVPFASRDTPFQRATKATVGLTTAWKASFAKAAAP